MPTVRTEPFETGIQSRDGHLCVVCGAPEPLLHYCHIIPKVEHDTVRYALSYQTDMVKWQEMKDYGFVSAAAKRVQHEPRNGI